MENTKITSAQYHSSSTSSEVIGVRATIDGQELFVPIDPANRHYAEIMRQVEAGTLTIQDAE